MKTLIFLILSGLSAVAQPSDSTTTVEGYLQWFGTDHFPQLAIVTEDHGRLFLEMERERRECLWRERKSRIRMTGRIYEGSWLGRPHLYIKPEKWRWIGENGLPADAAEPITN